MWPIFLDALRRRLIRWMVPGKRPRSRLVLTAVEPRIDFHRVPRGSFFLVGRGGGSLFDRTLDQFLASLNSVRLG